MKGNVHGLLEEYFSLQSTRKNYSAQQYKDLRADISKKDIGVLYS